MDDEMTGEGGGGFGASPSVMEPKGTGAFPSVIDSRTVMVRFPDTGETPDALVKGIKPYVPQDIFDQHSVGICTAISLVQNRAKVNGKRYSPDFQYLLQKKYIDGNWDEGSSALSALKVGKNFGFLPVELWTHTAQNDRKLPYAEYSRRLQAIPDSEIFRLIALCIDKVAGYGLVEVKDRQLLALGINASEAGLIVRYDTGKSWYTDVNGKRSWLTKDIDPIRKPNPVTSGHLIINNGFDYTNNSLLNHVNTWGIIWNRQGQCYINWDNYKMTEAWIITKTAPVIKPSIFDKTLRLGQSDPLVKTLQQFLNTHGFILATTGAGSRGKETNYFGNLTLSAVKKFQAANGIPNTGLVASLTRAELNRQWYN